MMVGGQKGVLAKDRVHTISYGRLSALGVPRATYPKGCCCLTGKPLAYEATSQKAHLAKARAAKPRVLVSFLQSRASEHEGPQDRQATERAGKANSVIRKCWRLILGFRSD
jgi:hypothetical protein